MYGRVFESLYEGSMMGAGSPMFAVWTYVITKMRADAEVGAQVDLNPKLLSVLIGEEDEVIEDVIEKLCAPDPNSRTPDDDGRRLVRLGQFSYRVVNGKKYIEITNLEEKRRADRVRKAKQRENGKGGRRPKPSRTANSALEREFERAAGEGDVRGMEAAVQASLPDSVTGVKTDEQPAIVPASEKPVSDTVIEDERPGHFEAGKWVLD